MKALRHPRRVFVAGLLVVLPVVVTIWLLGFVFRLLDGLVAPLLEALVGRHLPGLGLLLTLALVFVVGLLASNIVGARLLRRFEALLLAVPLVRSVFGPARQFFLAVASGGGGAGQEVVAVEYPRRGLYMVGFVTHREDGSVCVFLPTAPNPTSGFLVVCDPSEVHALDIPFDAAMRLIVSGGMVHPAARLLPERRARPPAGG